MRLFILTYDVTLDVDVNYEIRCISVIHRIVKAAILLAIF